MGLAHARPIISRRGLPEYLLDVLLLIIIITIILLTVKARRPISHSISVYMNVMPLKMPGRWLNCRLAGV